jgi:hypothetical protein
MACFATSKARSTISWILAAQADVTVRQRSQATLPDTPPACSHNSFCEDHHGPNSKTTATSMARTKASLFGTALRTEPPCLLPLEPPKTHWPLGQLYVLPLPLPSLLPLFPLPALLPPLLPPFPGAGVEAGADGLDASRATGVVEDTYTGLVVSERYPYKPLELQLHWMSYLLC